MTRIKSTVPPECSGNSGRGYMKNWTLIGWERIINSRHNSRERSCFVHLSVSVVAFFMFLDVVTLLMKLTPADHTARDGVRPNQSEPNRTGPDWADALGWNATLFYLHSRGRHSLLPKRTFLRLYKTNLTHKEVNTPLVAHFLGITSICSHATSSPPSLPSPSSTRSHSTHGVCALCFIFCLILLLKKNVSTVLSWVFVKPRFLSRPHKSSRKKLWSIILQGLKYTLLAADQRVCGTLETGEQVKVQKTIKTILVCFRGPAPWSKKVVGLRPVFLCVCVLVLTTGHRVTRTCILPANWRHLEVRTFRLVLTSSKH